MLADSPWPLLAFYFLCLLVWAAIAFHERHKAKDIESYLKQPGYRRPMISFFASNIVITGLLAPILSNTSTFGL